MEQDAEFCKAPIPPEKVMETMDYALGLYGHLYELYKSKPDMFGHLLVNAYRNWQQNGLIPISVHRGLVTLVKKDPNKGDSIDNFWPITLLNT